MLNFDTRTGPDFGAAAPLYPEHKVPDWWLDAKLGVFIHWGPYSIPAWATTEPGPIPAEDAYVKHRYAEWYANTVRIKGSPTWQRHQDLYGVGTSFEDLVDGWQLGDFQISSLIDLAVQTGAKYVIPTTKHHDGLCLWDSATTPYSTAKRGPKRDLIQEIHDATRSRGLQFGVYFSGALDWHVSDFPAIESDTDLFRFRRNDERFARYAAAQLEELIARFSPDVLWNDIEWPDGGKGNEDYALAALFKRYYAAVPEGVINDRWGIPYRGFSTREYSDVPEKQDYPWEATRGIGLSFGYNQAEDESQSLTGDELIRFFADVVAKGGNLLLNIGPRADGSVPDVQTRAMRALGDWVHAHEAAIRGTRPWGPGVIGEQRFVEKDGDVFVYLLHGNQLDLPAELAAKQISWLGTTATGPQVPAEVRYWPVPVARLS